MFYVGVKNARFSPSWRFVAFGGLPHIRVDTLAVWRVTVFRETSQPLLLGYLTNVHMNVNIAVLRAVVRLIKPEEENRTRGPVLTMTQAMARYFGIRPIFWG